MSSTIWDNKHKIYETKDWIDKPSIFVQEIIKYIPKNSKILELGAGQGQDTRYFAENGSNVISTDSSDTALEINKTKITKELENLIQIQKLDMTEVLPFKDNTFDVVYIHLAFHYFDIQTTKNLLNEIHRVLKNRGLLIMLTNSTTDPEYGVGELIEPDYYFTDNKKKRFFSTESLRELTKQKFNIVLLDNQGETYKDSEKGVHNLIRYVGEKIPEPYTHQTAVPFVGAIIERTNNGETEILIQTRWKPGRDPIYSGTLEMPAGKLDNGFENLYITLEREILEETGLHLKSIKNDSQTKVYSPRGDDAAFGFKPFCNVQQLENGKAWIGSIFICEVEDGQPVAREGEVKEIKWIKKSELKEIFEKTPAKLFTLEVPAWEYYFNQNTK